MQRTSNNTGKPMEKVNDIDPIDDDGFNEERLLQAAAEIVEIHKGNLRGRTSTFDGFVLIRVEEADGSVWTLEEGAKAFNAYLEEIKASRTGIASDQLVKAARSCLKQSQAGFAQLLGIPKRTVQNWEQGERKPNATGERLVWFTALFPLEALEAQRQQQESAVLV